MACALLSTPKRGRVFRSPLAPTHAECAWRPHQSNLEIWLAGAAHNFLKRVLNGSTGIISQISTASECVGRKASNTRKVRRLGKAAESRVIKNPSRRPFYTRTEQSGGSTLGQAKLGNKVESMVRADQDLHEAEKKVLCG